MFHLAGANENTTCVCDDGDDRQVRRSSTQFSTAMENSKNPFIVAARDDGDNHLQVRNIRNSISLTSIRPHRIIYALK
jgi:hypothetical protein